jgi:Bacterial Ig domain
MTRKLAALLIGTALLFAAAPAFAAWQLGSSAATAAAKARSIQAASAPTATPSGHSVALTWPETTLSGNGPGVTGYRVKRYDSGGTAQTVAAGCSGTVASAGCTEDGVPDGSWRYSVTPTQGPSWTGAESATTTVLVDTTAPTTMAALSPAPNASGWNKANVTVTLTATDAGAGAQQLTYGASGAQPIAPTTVAAATASFQVTIEGTTTVSFAAKDAYGNTEATKTQVVRLDKTLPTGAITAPAAGASLAGTVTVSANSADTPAGTASGVAAVVFERSSSGANTWTAIGTASTSPYQVSWSTGAVADGLYDLRATTTDTAGNQFTSALVTVRVQNNPKPTGLALANKATGTSGQPEPGDTVTVTYSGPLAVASLCSGWSGDGTNQSTTGTVTITDGGAANDTLTVTSATCGTFRFGTVDLGSAGFAQSGTVTFTASAITWNASTFQLAITLGTQTGTTNRVSAASVTATYTPNSAITGTSGAAISGTVSSTARQF